ncbi:Mitogen-activated protein kinase 9 [Glycine max]|nr:Mitogen-activated protein kinase 9 [Glycine max]
MNCEPSTQPISKLEFEFERRKLTKDDVRELIYGEILEYHPQMLQEYLRGGDQTSFMCLSGDPTERPSVEHILWNLQFAAQVQNSWRRDSSDHSYSPAPSS